MVLVLVVVVVVWVWVGGWGRTDGRRICCFDGTPLERPFSFF